MAKTDKEINFKIYLRILSYLKPYIKEMVLVFILSFAFIVASTLSMWLIAPVVTTFFTEEPIQQVEKIDESTLEEFTPQGTLNLNEWLKTKVYEFIPTDDRFATLKWLCIFIFASFHRWDSSSAHFFRLLFIANNLASRRNGL